MNHRIELRNIPAPCKDHSEETMLLSDQTMEERKAKVLQAMKERKLTKLVIYADIDHGMNFEYLVGFFPRFEEAILVLDLSGEAFLLLGNENLNKASKARIENTPIHIPYFSLPNQPMDTTLSMKELLVCAQIHENDQIGIIGRKLLTNIKEPQVPYFDVPSYIVDAIKDIVKNHNQICNATELMIGEAGVRTVNNANELAHYEYGASLASDAMLSTMDRIEVGVKEISLGNELTRDGQYQNVVCIASSGPRYIKGNMLPTNRCVQLGDAISLTVGYKGGLSSRSGYAIANESQLPKDVSNYLQRLVIPYYNAYVTWLETIKIGMKGNEMFQRIETVLPRNEYHWSLCPGHLVADEEWMSSPIYEGSKEEIKSGMMFQIDIIPSLSGYAGVCCESTIALANADLREAIKQDYPELYSRIEKRRDYLINTLGINLPLEVLPLCSSVAYLRPYLLSKEKALIVLN